MAVSLFLFGALGLAIDGSQLYAHRQMAQAAADAAAQAAIMSVRDGTNTSANSNDFGNGTPPASITCGNGSPPSLTPCYYAWLNGFSKDGGDAVQVDFPASVAGVTNLSSTPLPHLISVTITRTVNTSLMRFVGASSGRVAGHATAAILLPPISIPIIVTHPNLATSFDMRGTATIIIKNGPSTSIQVNSCAGSGAGGCVPGDAVTAKGGATVDLSAGGPDGGGGFFGNFGGPISAFPGNLIPSTAYKDPQSAYLDPLADVAAPTTTGRPVIGAEGTNTAPPNPCIVSSTANNPCQASLGGVNAFNNLGCQNTPLNDFPNTTHKCVLYYPGVYKSGFNVAGGNWAVFAPGLYYMSNGGFGSNPGHLQMANGMPASSETGSGMTVYNTGTNNTAVFNIAGLSTTFLTGDTVGTYGGILFFQDRNLYLTVPGKIFNHALKGGADLSLTGSIYMSYGTQATANAYNDVTITGGSGSITQVSGEVVLDTLRLNGNSRITMNLSGAGRDVRQVALVQ